jgi:hypothetical protein
MNLPWVSRLAFDVVVTNRAQLVTALAATDSVIAALRDDLTAERARNDALMEKYHALALPVLPVMATPVVREPAKPSVIAQAIRDESVGDPRLAAFLRNRSRELKLDHPDWADEQIATELTKWETTADPDVAS